MGNFMPTISAFTLDADLALVPGLNAEELRAAMDGHVLASGMLMGHYERK
jgi:phosphatidylethanolamine-binding protein (PEBP) family uncharacterized protein